MPPQRLVPAQPDPSGAAQPGTADESRRVPRGVGLGPPDAAEQAGDQGSTAQLPAAATHQCQPRSLAASARDRASQAGGSPGATSDRTPPARSLGAALNPFGERGA